jgi:penicillin amidase
LVLAAALYAMLTASLPRRGGEARLATLSASVAIELDTHAIPRIRARTFEDALRAQGFMHAQERYFQMDVLRRFTAGELAALLGEAALPVDRAQRLFQYRKRATAAAAALPTEQRKWLAAYVEGVNAGLGDLRARPPEYWVVRSRPEPWTVEDSLLVFFSYTTLSLNHTYERGHGVMQAVLAPEVYEFVTPFASRFDRPLIRDGSDPTGGYRPLPVPSTEAFGSTSAPTTPPASWIEVEPLFFGPASNQWVVSGERSAHGAAILANDPHLPLRIPSSFYRCELYWDGGVARGVGIPGLPGIVVGASDVLAWGVTNGMVDQSDWITVEVSPQDQSSYKTPDGSEPFAIVVEEIAVRGRAVPERLEVRTTRWGPVLDHDWLERPLVLHATWLEPGGVDLDIAELMFARDTDAAVRVVQGWAGPAQNWVLADAAGHIAWTVNGPMPRRIGFDGSRPESWADGTRYWQGELERPVAGDGREALYTANNRILPPEEARAYSGVWWLPLRAKRIEELLASRQTFAEREFLEMQLDTRAERYDAIRDIVLEVVADDDADELLRRARTHVAAWDGHAGTEQTGFRILHVFYRALTQRLLAPLLAPARNADPRFVYRWPLADEALRRLLEERPAYLLPPEFQTWSPWLRQILREALLSIESDSARPDIDAPWGEVNALTVSHPLGGLPIVGRWLRLPRVPLPGFAESLRAAGPSFGAVIRMAIAPGHAERAILQSSGGQSGHFLSDNFMDLLSDWVDGTATPFLAGATVAEITLLADPR